MTENINQHIENLDACLGAIKDMYEGDIVFNKPVSEARLLELESSINYRLPGIFREFYTKESNGIKIDNKCILPIFDKENKKTIVENIARYNDPSKELFFKGRPNIYNDYVIIGYDHTKLICISKKYDLPNPLLYICPSPNAKKQVDFYRTDFNLESFISHMVEETFSQDELDDWVLK